MAANPDQPTGQGYQPGQGVPVNQQYLQPHEGGTVPVPVPAPYQSGQSYDPAQGSHQQTSLPTSSESQWAQQAGPAPGHDGAAPQQAQQSFPPPPSAGQHDVNQPLTHFNPPSQVQQAGGHFPPPPQAHSAEHTQQYPPGGHFPPPPQAQSAQNTQQYPPPPPNPQQGISHTGVDVAPPPQWNSPQIDGQGAPSGHSEGQHATPGPEAQPVTASGALPPEKHGDYYAPSSGGNYPPPPPMPGTEAGQSTLSADNTYHPPLPPRRPNANYGDDDPNSPIHFSRDPHKLVAYLVPFAKPIVKGVETAGIPDRFLIYTPPPPPLSQPKEGEKEEKFHKIQRKWQEEVRSAKTSDAKVASWKGVKSRATKGISYVMSKTTSSNLDFVNRIPGAQSKSTSRGNSPDPHADDGVHEGDDTHKTVGLEEMILVYPSSYNATPEQVKVEFVNTMMRTKSKAQKDAVLATGLLPVSAAIDILATIVWPFGGLLEVDGVWAYSSIRGAKTARSVTKRLTSSTGAGSGGTSDEDQGPQLHLMFKQSPRLEVLDRYLAAKCQERDRSMFPRVGASPTETEVLDAIGWAPSQGEKNWEDEQWETQEVKDDMRNTFGKAAKEWDKWCKAFAKDPEKALKR